MTQPPASPDAARAATARTLAHYRAHARAFWEGTRDHDVSQNRAALLAQLEGGPVFRILDFGCGPGRDLKAFADLGHSAVGLDGCAEFCAMARAYSGCEVWEQDFLDLHLPAARFDGVFANAALFHVPGAAVPAVLRALHDTLVPRGVLFASNPHGSGEEGYFGGRWGTFHTPEGWIAAVTAAGFTLIDAYFRPAGQPRHRQPWHATVFRRA